MKPVSSYIAILMIRFYQKYISPYKGFCCAYHSLTGKGSCSNYALKVAKRYNLWVLLKVLPRQFERCHIAYQELSSPEQKEQKRLSRKQKKQEKLDKKTKEKPDKKNCNPNGCNESDADCGFSIKDCAGDLVGDCGIGDCGIGDCGGGCDLSGCDCGGIYLKFSKKRARQSRS